MTKRRVHYTLCTMRSLLMRCVVVSTILMSFLRVCVCVLVSRLYNMWGYFIRCCVGPVGQGRVRVRRDGEVDGVAEAVDLGVYGLGDNQAGNDLLSFLAA